MQALRLCAKARATDVQVAARQRALPVDLIAVERDAIQVVRLGETGAHLEVTHDNTLAKDLLEGGKEARLELELLDHRDHVFGDRVLRIRARPQPVEGHEGDSARISALELGKHPCGGVICVHDDMEELVSRRSLHGRVKLLINIKELDHHAKYAIDALLCSNVPDGLNGLPKRARHGLLQGALGFVQLGSVSSHCFRQLLLPSP
mmetsp:Transcript_10265/g.33926  ORF Transcript_10265/g.33926 Transcript_10265/m.33926 type:complete len:205 (-) Transcript_10265:1516-2130(-)